MWLCVKVVPDPEHNPRASRSGRSIHDVYRKWLVGAPPSARRSGLAAAIGSWHHDRAAELDCRDHRSRLAAQQAALRQLEAQHRLAASQLERARSLRERRGASQEDVEQRETELLGLDAQLASQREGIVQAQLNVDRCAIRAPYRAAVTARLGDGAPVRAAE